MKSLTYCILSERAVRYLQMTGGEPSQNLLKLIRQDLRLELRSALYQAIQRQAAVEARGLNVSIDGHMEGVNIHVRPIFRQGDIANGLILIVFEHTTDEMAQQEVILASDEPVARQLEEELIRLKAQLRASIEQHEFQQEELKASNEELQAMNEELRSAAEELETSKEELQSINEELRTVNQELKVKVEETMLASNNLQNLINSAEIATIFLDRSFRVVLFTPPARSIFNLIPNDIGRPLSDITNKLSAHDIIRDAETVLDKLQTIEHEVSTVDHRIFFMRLLPYRTEEDRINGVVITFFDITQRKQAEEALRKSEEKYRTLFNSMDEGVVTLELIFNEAGKATDFRYLEHNPAVTRQTGLTADIVGRQVSELFPDMEPYWFEAYERVATTGEPERHEYYLATLDHWFDIYISRVGIRENYKVICVYNNITERKRREQQQAFLLKLNDALRPLADPLKVQAVAADLLGSHLKANQAHYGEIIGDYMYISHSYGDGLPPMTGKFRHQDFGERWVEGSRTGTIQVCCNTKTEATISETERAILASAHIGAYVAMPLVKDGEWVVTLAVHSIEPRNWKQHEIDLVQEVAERTWADVERAKAEEALRQSEDRKAFLLHLSDILRPLTQAAQIKAAAVKLLAGHLHGNRAYYAENAGDNFIIEDDYHLADLPPMPRQMPRHTWGKLLLDRYASGITIAIEDVHVSPLFTGEDTTAYDAAGFCSCIGVPLVKNGIWIATLGITSKHPRIWTDAEIQLLEELAERTWTAVERARAEVALAKELADTKKLQQVSTHIIEEDNIQAFYEAILHSAMDIMQADCASIQTLLAEKQELYLVAYKNFHPQSAAYWEYVSADTTSCYAIAWITGERVIISDLENCPFEMEKNDYEAYRWSGIVSVQSTPLISRAGTYIGMLSTHWKQPHQPAERELNLIDVLARQAADLIERKQVEKALSESEKRLQRAVVTAKTVIWEWEVTKNKIETTSNFKDVYGLPSLAYAEQGYSLVHPDDRDAHFQKVQKAAKEGDGYYSRFRIIRPDTKETIWLEERADAIRDENGKVIKLVGAAIDITELKKIEEDLRESEQQLKHLLKQKDEFIGIASHELKTPITSVKAYAEIVQERLEETGDTGAGELLSKLNAQIDRLTILINHLLDTTRISEGQLKLTPEQFDFNDLLTERLDDIRRTTDHAFIWETAHLLPVIADRERIGQVITNLLTNAVKYSPGGSTITITAENAETEVQVSIRDEGFGIAWEDQKNIFERFFRVTTNNMDTFPGMGLGLYISAQIIQRHGGTIGVQSKLGEGSIFSFTIPYNGITTHH